jgi:hypothetical protein
MRTDDPSINFNFSFDLDKSVSHKGTHLVSVFSA